MNHILGGIQSPNPSYPQTIKSVTGNNNVVVFNGSLTEQGGINDTTGAENSATTRIKTDYVQISNYTSMQITSNNTSLVFRAIHFYNSSKTWISSSGYVGSALPYTITDIPSNAKYFKVVFQGQNASLDLNPTGNYLIIGTPQTLPLNLGNIELNGIDNYKDAIFKNIPSNPYYNNTLTEGSWYIKYNITKYTFTGQEEGWNKPATYTITIPKTVVGCTHLSAGDTNVLLNRFRISGTSVNSSGNSGKVYIGNNDVNFNYDDGVSTKNEFKTWLQTNTTGIMFPINTPTYTEITNTDLISQLEAIDNMQSYKGTTIITSTFDSNNAQMIIEGSALKGE